MRMIPTSRRVLADSVHHLPPGSEARRKTDPNQRIELTLGVRRLKQLPDLSALDVKRPGERRYMTREELRTAYGSDLDAVANIEKFAADNHLVVTRDERASARLGLAGTADNICTAFGVRMLDFSHPKLGEFHACTGPVSVLDEVADMITGVFGLNKYTILRRLFRKRRLVDPRAFEESQLRPDFFVQPELANIYNFPNVDASGQCIGLCEFGGGVELSDVTSYFHRIGLPFPKLQVVAPEGVSVDPRSNPDSAGEVTLDIEIAGALAGGAKVAVYFSTPDEKGVIDILSILIGDRANDPSVVSISWGSAENQPFICAEVPWSSAAIRHVNESLSAMAHLSISTCVASGDDGAGARVRDGNAHVNFPATSPYVLAVGGTTLHARTVDAGHVAQTEVTWNDGAGGGTGGGVSDITPVPAWQEGKVGPSINPGHFAGRAIPDVAAHADGYLIIAAGVPLAVSGTSPDFSSG
jgi:kumamolisin